jgi:shikimate dehydrogenase
MFNEAFQKMNMESLYLVYDIIGKNLNDMVKGLKILKFKGFNVTIPHKIIIMKFLDVIDEKASLIGAVNTVVNNNGKLIGYNTDVDGVLSAFSGIKSNFHDIRATILGSGGAARACIVALAIRGCKQFIILNRTQKNAKNLIKEYGKKLNIQAICRELDNQSIKKSIDESQILVNATSVGMRSIGFPTLVPYEFIKSKMIVFDVVYKPYKTKLLSESENKRCIIIPGIEMLIGQASSAFKLWTNKETPIQTMRKSALQSLGVY